MKCSKEAHERCLFSYNCTVGETVEDGSDCADFIRAVERGENGEPVGAFAKAEDAYLTEEREAIQQEALMGDATMTGKDIKKALYYCSEIKKLPYYPDACAHCPLCEMNGCIAYAMRQALLYIAKLERGPVENGTRV